MKVIVLAYHNIGCEGIEALLRNGYEIQAVFTHPDNPDENVWFDSVAKLAASKGISVFAPEDINHPIWVNRIREMNPDAIFSFYYRDMVGAEILDIPKAGCFNLHGSLLPKYRGRCPINWVLVNGEKQTGVTLHHMTPQPDDGDIVAQKVIDIEDTDTAKTLHEKAVTASGALLDETLPQIAAGKAPRQKQDSSQSSYYGGRRPKDGEIDWTQPAETVRNLVRAVTQPYPGAFTFLGARRCIMWEVSLCEGSGRPGEVLSTAPLVVACGSGAVRIDFGQTDDGIYISGPQLAKQINLVERVSFGPDVAKLIHAAKKTEILILGVDGFIGNAIAERLLDSGKYVVHGMDLRSHYLKRLIGRPDFHFYEGDISIHDEWIAYHIKKCDVVLPLVAIATPIEYIRNPLKVFELDFEQNLRVVRQCVKFKKRIIFPSTSEVYGMCPDEYFDEETSPLMLGPINRQRWIYSCCKQLLDRVIWAYGQTVGTQFTLFRPFNWIGPRLDSLQSARIGSSRAITQMILNLVEGTPIQLVDGGEQKRCFVDVTDAIEALFRIIENEDGCCDGRIINIGNPDNEASIREMAEILVEKFKNHPLAAKFPPFAGYKITESGAFYGKGYQDMQRRKPSVNNARKILKWEAQIPLETSIEKTFDFFLREEAEKFLIEHDGESDAGGNA